MSTQHQPQMHDRVLATAHVARAVVMLEREIAQNKTGVLQADDLAANFKRLGVADLDVPYIFARLCGNPIDPLIPLVVSPCLLDLVVPPAGPDDVPAPDTQTLREWAGIPPVWMRPKKWARRTPRKTAFDRSMPAAAFRAVVAAFSEITFSSPLVFEGRKQRHFDALRALMPREEAAMFVDLAAAASIAGVLQKVNASAGTDRHAPAPADDTPRQH